MSSVQEITDEGIIALARVQLDEDVSDVLAACESFYGHGFADEITGDVDGPGHFYRVARWIVTTDSQGFHYLAEFEDEATARSTFQEIEAQVSRFYDESEDWEG